MQVHSGEHDLDSQETRPLLDGQHDTTRPVAGIDVNKMDMRSFMTACAANLYEYYDFALLGFFATEISSQLFPNASGAQAIISLFGLYAVGFVARPFGGVVFGYLGDRYGRKFSLTLAMILMSFPTFLTGCIPGYSYIGWWAPVILLLLRVMQGLSTGGENSSSSIYIYESVPKQKRAFWLSIYGVCSSGTVIASFSHVLLQHTLHESQMLSWGWRIPFMAGLGLFVFSFVAKKWLKKTETFAHLENSPYVHDNPFTYVLYHDCGTLVKFVFASTLQHGSSYLIFVFLPSYLSSDVMRGSIDSWTDDWAYTINCVNSVLFLPIGVLVGYYTDRFGSLPFLCVSALFATFLSPFVFYGLALSTSTVMNWFLQFLLAMSCVPTWGCIFYWYIHVLLTDPRTRVTIYGVGYNLGAALFGGTASLMATWLVTAFGPVQGMILSGVWMSVLSVISIVTILYTVWMEYKMKQKDVTVESSDGEKESERFTSTWYLNPRYQSLESIPELEEAGEVPDLKDGSKKSEKLYG